VSADGRAHEVVRAFKERHSHLAGGGLRGIEPAYSGGEPCLFATVDPGFGSARLPAVFMGLPVVMYDGAHWYDATGEVL
jgi:hypothetical protein